MKFLVPEQLETDRLIMRQFQDADWRALHHYYTDELCVKYTIGRKLTEGETWRTMASIIGHWQLRGYGPYALEEKKTRQLLGMAGLWYPNDWPEPEILWGLIGKYWGKGYASEASLEVRRMAYDTIENCNLISLILKGNEASAKVAQRIGASLEQEIIFRDQPALIFRHTAP